MSRRYDMTIGDVFIVMQHKYDEETMNDIYRYIGSHGTLRPPYIFCIMSQTERFAIEFVTLCACVEQVF